MHEDDVLTKRELEILGLLMFLDKEIAARLGVTPRTVKLHAAHIKQKLGAHTRTMAVVVAHRRRLINLG